MKENMVKEKQMNEENVDVDAYAPHQGLGPAPYEDPEAMKKLKEEFQGKIEEFLDNTSPDKYNADFADNIIYTVMQEALIDVEKQYAEHIRTIERSILSIWKGDAHYYKQLLKDNEEEYRERKKQLKVLKTILYKGTAYEEWEDEEDEEKNCE